MDAKSFEYPKLFDYPTRPDTKKCSICTPLVYGIFLERPLTYYVQTKSKIVRVSTRSIGAGMPYICMGHSGTVLSRSDGDVSDILRNSLSKNTYPMF